MQTPVGYVVNEAGQFEAQDWWTIVFNPSFPYRLTHTVLAAYLTTALVVGGVGAWHLLRDRGNKGARVMFSMATGMMAVVAPLQIFAGDMHGLNTLEHQPAKVMAMEGHFESHPDGAPLILFGIPDQEAGQVRNALSVPKALLADPQARPERATDRARHGCRANWPYVAGRLLVIPHHGGHRVSSCLGLGRSASWRGSAASSTTGARCTASRSPWGRRASSR